MNEEKEYERKNPMNDGKLWMRLKRKKERNVNEN